MNRYSPPKRNRGNLHDFDDLLNGEGTWQVVLVSEDQDRDAGQLRLVQQVTELCPGCIQLIMICRIQNEPNHVGNIR